METKEKKAPAPKQEVKKDTWEYKDRNYFLKGNKEPITFKLGSRHTGRHSLLWFDPERGHQRELRYASNQKSVFVDEQEGPVTLQHIIFKDGALTVPKEKQNLQKLLSLYHPHRNKLFEEHKPAKKAASELSLIQLEIDALNAAQSIEIDMAEAIMRVEIGSRVSEISSSELKRDLLIFAKKNPKLFLDLVNDENVVLRNFGIKATEMGILKLSTDQRMFTWGSNDRKLMNVPFDEHPYSALASWFKTDEGMEIYQNIEKRLK